MNYLIAASAISLAASMAAADAVDFVVYSDNAGSVPGINTVAELSADLSSFTITLSNDSTSGYISNFYLEIGAASFGLGDASIQNSNAVAFVEGGSPPNPGGGLHTTEGGAWEGSFFKMKASNPRPQMNSINVGESLSVIFDHDGSFSLAALMDALAANEVRMVQHYRGYGTAGESAWLTTDLTIVPLPAAAWAGLGMLGVIVAARRRQG